MFTKEYRFTNDFSESPNHAISMRFGHVLSLALFKSCDQKLAITLYDDFTSESRSIDSLVCLTAWAWSLHCVWYMAAAPRLCIIYRALWKGKRVHRPCDYDGPPGRRPPPSESRHRSILVICMFLYLVFKSLKIHEHFLWELRKK